MHHHGTPITPRSVLYELAGRNFCVSYSDPRDVKVCHQIGQSVMLDNGAYTAWTQGRKVDWQAWWDWAEPWLEYHNTWAVLPDSITGGEAENDWLAADWAWIASGRGRVVPVWHLHESMRRLQRLVDVYGRVCFGSSGQYATIMSEAWRRRVGEAFDTISDDAGRVPWVHMLRGMALSGSEFPFASVDSTDIARNHSRNGRTPQQMADRWDGTQCPARWDRVEQLELEAVS